MRHHPLHADDRSIARQSPATMTRHKVGLVQYATVVGGPRAVRDASKGWVERSRHVV
jgi:hypothetical protein